MKTPAAPPVAAPRPPVTTPVVAATDEAVAGILNFRLPSSATFLRPQVRVRLRKVARHRYAPAADPFGSWAVEHGAPTQEALVPQGGKRLPFRAGVSPAVAFYRAMQGGAPDPAPPLDPSLAALTLGFPARDAREALRVAHGGCRRLELFARSSGVVASALRAAKEAGVKNVVVHASKADGAWAQAAARADLALAKSLGAHSLCTDAFACDDSQDLAKLAAFSSLARPVKVVIGRRAFDDVLRRKPNMAERRDVLHRLGAAGVEAVYTSGGSGDAWTSRKTLKELLLIAKNVPGSPNVVLSGGVVLDCVKRLSSYTGAQLFALDGPDAPKPPDIIEETHETQEEVRPSVPAPDVPPPSIPPAWVADALALAPPRAPATPAAAAALVSQAAAFQLAGWSGGGQDPKPALAKAGVAPRRFGGPSPPPPPPRVQQSPRSDSSSPRTWSESPRTCRKGCGWSFGHPPARTAHEKTCRGLKGSSTRTGREHHYSRTSSRAASPQPGVQPARGANDHGTRSGSAPLLLASPRQDAWPGLGFQGSESGLSGAAPFAVQSGEAGGWPGLGDPEEVLGDAPLDFGGEDFAPFDFGGDPLLLRSRAPSAGSWADLGSAAVRPSAGSWGELGDAAPEIREAPFALPPSPLKPFAAAAPFVVPPVAIPPPPDVAPWPETAPPKLSPRAEVAANDAAIAQVIAEQGGYVGLPSIPPPPAEPSQL